jgi:hypothetical protein
VSQNGKYQLITAVVLMLGAGWFHHSTQSTPAEQSTAFERKSNTNGAISLAVPSASNTSSSSASPAQASNTPVVNSKFSSRLERHVNYIALLLSRPDVEIPPQAMATAHLSSEELSQLGNAVVDMGQDASTRQASLFILSKSGAKAIPALGMIAASSFKDSVAQTEVPLRITALESLDQLTGNQKEVLQAMQTTIDKQSNRTLVFLASISAGGIKQGKPGKLGRAMELMIKEKSL